MFDFELMIPGKIAFGEGKLKQAGELFAGLGKKAMIVCDKWMSSSGTASRLSDIIGKSGISSVIYDKVIPNPTVQTVDEGAVMAREEKCDFVIGLGGGSSIDTAKGIAAAAVHEGSVWQYAIGEKELTAAVLPIAAITTTSGTGSHCTCFAVISNEQTHQKPGMGSPHILPSISLVDPELMLTVPKQLTLITGFDVFSHAVEALTSKASNPVSDIFAEKAIELVVKHLPESYENGTNIEARSGMALADTYSGIAISHAVVTLGHVMAHVIGGHYPDISHGDALYSIYREILKFNSAALPEKHDFIRKNLSPGAQDLVSAFDDFFGQFKFENRLKEKAPDGEAIEKLASDTFTYMKGIADLNPVEADSAVAEKILSLSLN